jgi:hypothetical protein
MTTKYQFELTSILLTINVNKIKSSNDTNGIDTQSEPNKTIIEEMLAMNDSVNLNNTFKNDSFECTFIAQSYKTAKLFELNIESFDLPKINNIFAIDPTIMYDIIKEKPNSISIAMSDDKEDHVIIEYLIDFFNRNISLIFKMPEKQYSEGSDSEVIDLKRMNRLIHQEISEMKKIIQQSQNTVDDFKTKIVNLNDKFESRVSGLQKEFIDLMNDNNAKTEKTIIIIPFNNLVVSPEIAHDFMNDYYCCDEYKKLAASKANTTKQIIVDEFLNTRLKKLLFNMHYINRINQRKFVSIYNHCTNQGPYWNKISAVNDSGLGFITVHTEKKYRYAKFDDQFKFDNSFVFNWSKYTTQPNEDCDLFTTYSNIIHPQNNQQYGFALQLKIAQLK